MAELVEKLFEVSIKGPAPYGFRLYGGDGDPIIVAKLRARSKAHDAGLREGDVVLGINGRSCQTISHGIALTLLETAEDILRLHLFRGSSDRSSLSAAFGAAGNHLRPVSPGTAPPNRSIFSIQPSPATGVESPAQPPIDEAPALAWTSNVDGSTRVEHVTSYSRQEVTSVEGDVAQKTTTETKDLGGVTLTKVTREVVKGPDSSATWAPTAVSDKGQSSRVVTQVSKVKAQPVRWAPEGSTTPGHFQVKQSITFELEGKENLAPNRKVDFGVFSKDDGEPQKFKVYKTTAKRWVWQPDHVPDLPVRESSPPATFEVLAHREFQSLEEQLGEGEGTKGRDTFGLNPQLIHVLTTEGTYDDFALGRKKKIFADSSFYDDPDQKYPTIEDQIKMARKVALSLSASDNVTAVGQRMFLKRKEKANLWSTDQSLDGLNPYLPQPPRGPNTRPQRTTKQPLHYNPTPWKIPQAKKVERVVSEAMKESLEGYPEDPAASSAAFAKNRSLFEKGVGFRARVRDPPWKKALSESGQAPQVCVGLANDLKGMKGKGAKLFAQRRAKVIEEEGEEEAEAEWYSEGEGIGLSGHRKQHNKTSEPIDPQEAAVRRLEELIAISKSYLSPWESNASSLEIPIPWQTTAPVYQGTEQQVVKGWTDDDLPSFIVKKSHSSSYRPVKFHFPWNDLGSGVTDF